MDRKFLDLYSDYLISSFGKVTATGLSELLDGERQFKDEMQRYLMKERILRKGYDSQEIFSVCG